MVEDALNGGTILGAGTDNASARGLELLRAVRRVTLKRLMRAKDDPDFIEVQRQMRDPDVERPVPGAFLDKLHTLSAADLAEDEEWRFAPVGVLNHLERDVINVAQLEAFARAFNLPLVRWPLTMVEEIEDENLRRDLYADEPDLWAYFVEGAPVNLTETLKSVRKLVNGAPGILDSLSFADGKVPHELAAAYATGGFCVVELKEPPLAVNVRIGGKVSPPGSAPGSAPGSVLWHGVELDDLSDRIESVTPVTTAQVVSLLVSPNIKEEGVPLRGLVAAQNHLSEKVMVRGHAYMLAWALTDNKLQGRTLPKLILSILKRKLPPWMTLSAFYVLISRVRTSA